MKAHPALFEGERGGEGQKKVSTNTFISVYIHIHIQTAKARTLCVYLVWAHQSIWCTGQIPGIYFFIL